MKIGYDTCGRCMGDGSIRRKTIVQDVVFLTWFWLILFYSMGVGPADLRSLFAPIIRLLKKARPMKGMQTWKADRSAII